jgi:hypothetical protein
MAAKNLRCDMDGCPSVVVPRSTVAPIVALACLIALFLPFVISLGLRPNSHISWGAADIFYTPGRSLSLLFGDLNSVDEPYNRPYYTENAHKYMRCRGKTLN